MCLRSQALPKGRRAAGCCVGAGRAGGGGVLIGSCAGRSLGAWLTPLGIGGVSAAFCAGWGNENDEY